MTEYFLAGLSGKSLEMNLLIVDIWKKFPQYFNDDSNKNDEAYPSEYTKLASIKDLRKNKFRIQPRR